jgi:hypothetical protein
MLNYLFSNFSMLLQMDLGHISLLGVRDSSLKIGQNCSLNREVIRYFSSLTAHGTHVAIRLDGASYAVSEPTRVFFYQAQHGIRPTVVNHRQPHLTHMHVPRDTPDQPRNSSVRTRISPRVADLPSTNEPPQPDD